MGGFKCVSNEASPTSLPQPDSETTSEILRAIRSEGDADSFLGVLSSILSKKGFTYEANKVIRYPSIFCPCTTHSWKDQLRNRNYW